MKPTQNSELAQILINKYERDLDAGPSKEKKKAILDLFRNSNNLRSEEELKEITQELHDACSQGDIDLIKIYLSETIENDSKSLKFKIDRTNQTASLFKVSDNIEELVIPRTVRHELTDFLITSISGFCKNITTLKFVEDSAVKTFYRNAISFLKAEEIQFPSSLKELKEGWCHYAKIKKFEISPLNDQFVFKDNKYLLGKSDENNNEFDVLLYVRRDIEVFSLPSNIKIISSCALSGCYNLSKVEIPPNSNLQIIGKNAFSSTNIKEIYIPPNVTKICAEAFAYCEELTKVEIPTNSNLQTIESNAFDSSKVEEIYFPASLKELKAGWCNLLNFTKIEISPLNDHFVLKDNKYLLGKSDENNDEFDVLLYAYRNIEEISIPPNIKIISPLAFAECKQLKKVEIPQNSNLQIIDRHSFFMTNIKRIFIPPKVTKIGGCAFTHCKNLIRVEIPQNSNLQTIEDNAFMNTNITEIFIPPKVTKIGGCAFIYCKNLTRVEIPQNSNLQTIEDNAFKGTNIKDFFISSKISTISKEVFQSCMNLQIIEISEESELESCSFRHCYQDNLMIMCPSKAITQKFHQLL